MLKFNANRKLLAEFMTGYPDFDLYLEELNLRLRGPQSIRILKLTEIREQLLDKRHTLLKDASKNRSLDLQVLKDMENIEQISKIINKSILKKVILKILSYFILCTVFGLFIFGMPESKIETLALVCWNMTLATLFVFLDPNQQSTAYVLIQNNETGEYKVKHKAELRPYYKIVSRILTVIFFIAIFLIAFLILF